MSGVRPHWRWAYEDAVEQWAEEEVERELAAMDGPLEQLEETEEEGEERGSPVYRARSEADCNVLFARVSAARAVFLEGARSFLDSSVQEVQSLQKGKLLLIVRPSVRPFCVCFVCYCCSSVGE